MSNYLILHAIHNCELIKGCRSTTLSTLYDLSYYESFKRNEVIAKQDAPAEELLILASGQVGVYRRNEQGSNLLVAKVTTGGWFGEASFIPGFNRVVSIKALEDAIIVKLPTSRFIELCQIDPMLMRNTFSALARRGASIGHFALNNMTTNIPLKIARTILSHIEILGNQEPGKQTIKIKMTRSELAMVVGITRQALNKYIVSFVEEGTIAVGYGSITINSLESLKKKIETLSMVSI